ncbi:uncharacterized protein [Drosophila virilis]|uniref:RING-type domain-containing protein n=1 Tax=Drosophila virilis TaxID=7244 RepID=B4LBK8_DROVI|nr:uncharacterized protein LOC6622156 [Drosophila virilis]EDW70818.2 uncharacterized protein Dvir_GJ13990 [Drosophila virilis]
MFRFNGDSNTTNNIMSHAIRRSQFALERAVAEQCMMDDQYFSLLYKNYDGNSLATSNRTTNNRTHSIDEPTHISNSSNNLGWPRNDNDKAWTSSLLDYRNMDAELTRLQLECENIESTMARVGSGTLSNKPTETSEQSNREFNLIGSAVPTAVRLPTPPRGPTSRIDLNRESSLNASALAIPAVSTSIRHRHTSTLEEISYRLPSLSMIGGSNVASANNVALPPLPPSPIRSASPVRPAVEQPSVRRKESELLAPATHMEPYKCPVCLKCVRQRKPASTICGHVFCSSCIKTALRATCKCPVCQRLMTTRQIFRIFI